MTSLTLAGHAGPEQADAPCFAQRQSALQRANEVRSGIAQVKRELATGVLSFEEALMDERARRMKIRALLLSLPWWGDAKASRTLAFVRVPEHRLVRDLTLAQCERLVRAVMNRDPDKLVFWKRQAMERAKFRCPECGEAMSRRAERCGFCEVGR